jgi:DNA-binding Lrp family transcriptional regulator
MIVDDINQQLLVEIQHGLPIASRPYAVVGEKLGLSEQEVIARLAQLQSYGLIKRLGVIVKHRKLGYQANAMVVWDIPDEQVQLLGQQLSQFEFVNLCYRRPRQGAAWPYNLFCMIHGKSREIVLQQIEVLKQACQLQQFPQQILFSRRCFKQRGAVYAASTQELSHG